MIKVEVVYAAEDKQTVLAVEVSECATVAEAISQSLICQQHPEIDLHQFSVGIYSKKVALDTVVKAGDRIEIYRSLTQDPKARRLKKA